MPDDDRFPRYLSPAWGKVLRCLQGHDPVERVGDAATKAVAATIRTVHGIPSLPRLAEKMREAASRGDSLRFDSPAGRDHVPTRIAEQAAASLATTMQGELALVSPTGATLLLARRVVKDLAYHYGFDRMVQALPPESYGHGDLRAVMTAALAGDPLAKLAARFAADRLVSRPSERERSDGSGWGRQLWLQVPVRNPSLWNSVVELLTGLLGWLTDDIWSIDFSQLAHDAGPLDNLQGFLFDTVPRSSPLALFSGGLDSALGLAQDLRSSDAVAVSVHTNNRMKTAQRRVVRALDGGTSTSCLQLQYRISLREPERENSQRTRGLLFLATGIATAWTLGQDRLRVYENGIGAINLPYLRSQEGSQATRSMHPRTLRMAEGLASAVSGRSFQVEAPYLLLTKAEAVRAVPEIDASIIAAAVSCDTAFAAKVPGAAQCGSCTSCLLRRQALIAGGRSDADEVNRYRTRSPAGTSSLAAMTWQLERLRDCLNTTDQWQGIVSEFPPIMDVERIAPAQLTRLYGAYVREWGAVDLASFRLRGDRSAALCKTKSDQS